MIHMESCARGKRYLGAWKLVPKLYPITEYREKTNRMCPLKHVCYLLGDSVISLLMQRRVANSNLRVLKLKNILFPSPAKCIHLKVGRLA